MDYLNIEKEVKINHHPRLFSLYISKTKWTNNMKFQPSHLHLKYKKKPFNSIGFILAFIVLISLFSETTRTIPVGSSEYFNDSFNTVPKLNLKTLEVKLLNNFSKFNEEPQYVYKDKTADDKMNSNRENIISKIVETYFALKEKMQNKETIVEFNWDLDNLNDLINFYTKWDKQRLDIANEGQKMYLRYTSGKDAGEFFANHLMKILKND